MGLFNRTKPEDTNALYSALRGGAGSADFDEVYQPAYVGYDYEGDGLLALALTNGDPAERIRMANRLLDDGADVTRNFPLQVLIAGNKHDFSGEAALLKRMLDMGADVNSVARKSGTPLEAVAMLFGFSDEDLAPVYDVLLVRPDIDLVQPGLDGRPVLTNLRLWHEYRSDLVKRCEALLDERGIPRPK